MLAEGHDELQIFTHFMKAERKLQKAMERMHTKTEDTNTKKENGQQGQCNNCGKAGHSTAACYAKKKHAKSQSTQKGAPRQPSNLRPMKVPCPACNQQHMVQGRTSSTTGAGSRSAPRSRT